MNDTDRSQYSRAFETFVQDRDDLIGLIAYALYKQNMREMAASGRPPLPPPLRVPTPTETDAYRGDAERRLQNFAAEATREATPDIIEHGVTAAINAAAVELTSVINRRTSLRAAIAANLVAWIVTAAITIVVIATIYLPNWQADLVERLRQTQLTAPPSNTTPAPGQK